jgi:outer membrane protein/protease secretion system outer membrane protein
MPNKFPVAGFAQKLARFVGILLAVVFSQSSLALDLLQSYRLAVGNDASFLAARAAAESGREVVPQALSQLLPMLSLSASGFKNQLAQSTPDATGQLLTYNSDYRSSSVSWNLRQPIYRKYQFAQYQQAKAQLETVEATLSKDEQDLASRVAGAYFDALLAEDQLSLVLAQKSTYAGQLESAKRSFKVGEGSRTDIDEAQSRYDLTLATELEARQKLISTRSQLQVYVNEPVTTLATLDENKLVLAPPDPARLESWIDRGEEASPELRTLKAQREVAQQQIEKALAGHHPTLDLVAQQARSVSENMLAPRSQFTNLQVGVQLTMPLYAGGGVNSSVREARANREKIGQQYEATRRNLGLQIQNEFQNVSVGVARVRALEQARLSSEQAFYSTQKGVQAGTRMSIDVLNAEQMRISVLRDLAQARYQYLIAKIRLLALVGGLSDLEMARVNACLKSRS